MNKKSLLEDARDKLNYIPIYSVMTDSEIESLNKKLDNTYNGFCDNVKSNARKINEDVFPNYYKVNEFEDMAYLQEAMNSIAILNNKINQAIKMIEKENNL